MSVPVSEKTQSDQKLKRINQMKNDGIKINCLEMKMFFMRINILQFMINRLNGFHIACFHGLRRKLIIMNGGMARNRTRLHWKYSAVHYLINNVVFLYARFNVAHNSVELNTFYFHAIRTWKLINYYKWVRWGARRLTEIDAELSLGQYFVGTNHVCIKKSTILAWAAISSAGTYSAIYGSGYGNKLNANKQSADGTNRINNFLKHWKCVENFLCYQHDRIRFEKVWEIELMFYKRHT